MEHCHEGHRERLLATVSKVGLKNLSDYQTLEYILTFIIPRKDTNPLAHRLLDEFGSLSKVLEADYKLTMKIEGLGETTAKKLATFKDIVRAYIDDKCKNQICLENYRDLYNYAKNKFMFDDTEKFCLVGLNANFKVLACKEIDSPKINSVTLPIKTLLEFIYKFSIDKLLVLHNHPNKSAVPSQDDIDGNDKICQICASNLIEFYDHIIFGNKEMYSMQSNSLYLEKDIL